VRHGVARALAGVIVLLAWLAQPRNAAAVGDFFESSPGALSASHAALDAKDRCNDCHVDGTKDLSGDRCLRCHDHQGLGVRIKSDKGLHASAVVKGRKCESCHQEHKGTDTGNGLLGWSSLKGGVRGFDHELTGWRLEGKHASTACKDCHKQAPRTYLGADRRCDACHQADEPHQFSGRDAMACERCHGVRAWRPASTTLQFDHDDRKDAAMPLLGSHRDVACARCHPKNVYHLPFDKPDACGNAGCHKSPHDGHLFGARPCQWCHSPAFRSLKDAQAFDHSERTRFDLGPGHRKLPCGACHSAVLGEVKPSSACEGCHVPRGLSKVVSHHGDRFSQFGSPPRCEICHASSAGRFVPTNFNHNTRTRFELHFEHTVPTCRGCHRGSGPADFERFAFDPNKECMSCHAHAMVHRDEAHPKGRYQNSQCLLCHQQRGDPPDRRGPLHQAHDPRGSFPLVKGHKDLACATCHVVRDARGRTSFSGLKPNCNAGQCHGDALHEGTLGASCVGCHAGGSWDALGFDHDRPFPADARGKVGAFPLNGEHRKTRCDACHPGRKFSEAPTTCAAAGCHAADDAHQGRLGDRCEHCHLETGDNTFSHNTTPAFRLDGKHLAVPCWDCHPSVTFKPRPTDCFGCHPETAVHRGRYGTDCARCHTTRAWKDVKPPRGAGGR